MIMGRRTFEAIGRVLPGRESIVVTRRGSGVPREAFAAADPRAALDLARERAQAMRAGSIALIGGASLFETMMDDVDRLAMTLVDLAPEADTFFPMIDPSIWHEARRSTPSRHPDDEADCVFLDYERAMPSTKFSISRSG